MAEKTRFQKQAFDKKDYEQTESAAKKSKKVIGWFTGAAVIGGVVKKYGPQILKKAGKAGKLIHLV